MQINLKDFYVKALICVLFTMTCVDASAFPELSSGNSKVYYVIQNASTKEYLFNTGSSSLRIRTESSIDDVHILTNNYSKNGFLWYFTNGGVGSVKISNLNNDGSYLNKDILLGGLHQFETETDVAWTLVPSDFNQAAYWVKNGTDYWHADKDAGTYYLKLSSSPSDDLDGWIFKTYDDLLDEAVANGLTRETYKNDTPDATAFKTLTEAIASAKSNASVPTIIDGTYLLVNRRYGLYLNTNGTAMNAVSTPTQYSVWQLSTEGGVRSLTSLDGSGTSIRVTDNGENDNNATASWTINASVSTTYHVTFGKSSDGDVRYVNMNYDVVNYPLLGGERHTTVYFGLQRSDKAVYSTTSGGITSDWQFIPVTNNAFTLNGTTYEIDEAVVDESQLTDPNEDPTKTPFFRLRNVGRSVTDYTTDIRNGGGWLEDVDLLHFTRRKTETGANMHDQAEANLMYTARTAEFYAAMPDMGHASALWEFILVGHASTADENATGLVSPEHNIYVLKNVNTCKYIGAPDTNGNFTATTSKTEAAPFYITQLVDGQVGLTIYKETTSSGDASDGAFSIGGTGDGYAAGLTKGTNATKNSSSAWIILAAETLNLQLLIRGTDDGYDWSTFYFPFDVKLGTQQSGQEVKFFQGGWNSTNEYIDPEGKTRRGGSVDLIEVANVPAGNAVIVRSSRPTQGSFDYITLNVYPAGGMVNPTSADAFGNNVWKGIVESDDKAPIDDNWRDYWILSKNSSSNLKLLHPYNSYLLPNRAYLDVETLDNGTNVKVVGVDIILTEDDELNGIVEVENDFVPQATNIIYSLDGRRINSEHLEKGVYIVNNKKMIVK